MTVDNSACDGNSGAGNNAADNSAAAACAKPSRRFQASPLLVRCPAGPPPRPACDPPAWPRLRLPRAPRPARRRKSGKIVCPRRRSLVHRSVAAEKVCGSETAGARRQKGRRPLPLTASSASPAVSDASFPRRATSAARRGRRTVDRQSADQLAGRPMYSRN